MKKSEKKQKKRKNRLEFRFASKQKLLNQSEAKNLKRKKVKKIEKNAKKFASLWSENYSSEVKREIWSENKWKEAKKEKWNFIVK